MSLITDKQTLDDLNIFGKRGANAIYNIFNRAFTRGGAELLEEIFRRPLADMDAINQRSATIRFFASSSIPFPYENEWFDAAEHYLQQTDNRSMLSETENTLGRKFNQLIAADTELKEIQKSVAALVHILRATDGLLSEIGVKAAGTPYAAELQQMQQLVHAPELQPALQ
ncbi:MAG: MutS-related protein, partial [Pseudobacter sp.]